MMTSKKMPPAIRDHALLIAHHEMAHYVVARALGFATGGVSLTVTMDLRHQGGASINLVRPIPSLQEMKAYLEARMMVLLAGAMGQTLSSKRSSKKRVDKSQAAAILNGALGAEQDYAKVRELRYLLRNMAYPETDPASADRIAAELKMITDQIWQQTQDIVEGLAETITELALALVDGMVLVEQWGRTADSYEVVWTGDMLEQLEPVQGIAAMSVRP
ncbi:MAG: peptidase [Pseudomonas sp.]|nr:peptidase [Pseudomonas sp.]